MIFAAYSICPFRPEKLKYGKVTPGLVTTGRGVRPSK
jgi:hypothetical protein